MQGGSGSFQSLEVAKSWLRNCIENHDECVEGGTTLPSRVLDISLSNDMITLVDGSGLSGRYASLSYCVSRAVSRALKSCWKKKLTQNNSGGMARTIRLIEKASKPGSWDSTCLNFPIRFKTR
jgi:hypothetical protein